MLCPALSRGQVRGRKPHQIMHAPIPGFFWSKIRMPGAGHQRAARFRRRLADFDIQNAR